MAIATRQKIKSVDVAKHAGVSQTVVSFVLNGRRDVSIREDTRERVLEAARILGYTPNTTARSLRTGKSHMVGVYTPSIRGPIFAQAIDAFATEAQHRSYNIVVGDPGLRSREDFFATAAKYPVDGVIAYDRPQLGHLDDDMANANWPIVSLGSKVNPYVDHIQIDLYTAFVDMLEHLYDQGCRRIALLGRDWSVTGDSAPWLAYRDFMHDHGLALEVIAHGSARRSDVHAPLSAHIATAGVPEAILCHCDDTAIGANATLYDLGISVPGQVLLAGADGIEDVEFHRPSLSTIAFPLAELSARAWDFLEARMKHPGMPVQSAKIVPSLVLRQSTQRDK